MQYILLRNNLIHLVIAAMNTTRGRRQLMAGVCKTV